jgi:hypothetical protein
MNPSPGLIDLLNQLKRSALASEFAENNLLSAMENLLVWIDSPDNNPDLNSKQMDYFVSTQIIVEHRFKDIPENLGNIFFDMGATLHDTHTTPEIAENFESTPAERLARLQNL